MNWLEKLFEEHKFVHRASMIWACWLVTMVVFMSFEKLEVIDGPRATLIGGFVGILSTIVGLYTWIRQQDDKAKEKADAATDAD